MEQLIAHLFGDYILQNHWMANEKTKRWFPALVHAALYTMPFVLLTQSPYALGTIFGTHVVIDRFRLARYWQEWYGVGCTGRFWMWKYKVYHGPHGDDYMSDEIDPAWEEAPPFLKVWLLIIIDNSFHLLINLLSIKYL